MLLTRQPILLFVVFNTIQMHYTYFKLLHLLAVVLYLGNMIIGQFWMRFANKTKNQSIINHTIKGLIRADRIFALPSVVIITLFGLLAAMIGNYPIMRSGWIAWSITTFMISGLAFSFRIVPLQRRMFKMTSADDSAHKMDWAKYTKTLKQWNIWDIIVILTAFSAFVMMTLKLPK